MLTPVAAPVSVLPTYPNLVPPWKYMYTKFLSDIRTEPRPPSSPSLQRAFSLQPLEKEMALTTLSVAPCLAVTGFIASLGLHVWVSQHRRDGCREGM